MHATVQQAKARGHGRACEGSAGAKNNRVANTLPTVGGASNSLVAPHPLPLFRTGNMVVTGSWDRTIRIWDAADGKELRRLDRNQHVAPITSVKWHPK